MLDYTTTDGRLRVYEASSAYWLQYPQANLIACIGDGVDMIFDEDGNAFSPGTQEFDAAITGIVEDNTDDYIETYFHVGETE